MGLRAYDRPNSGVRAESGELRLDSRVPLLANPVERRTVEVPRQPVVLLGRNRITGDLVGGIQLRVPIERGERVLQRLIVTADRQGLARTMQRSLRTGDPRPLTRLGSGVEAAGQAYQTDQQHSASVRICWPH